MGTVELLYLDVFKTITTEIQIDAADAEQLRRSSLGVSSNLLFCMILAKLSSCCPKLVILPCFQRLVSQKLQLPNPSPSSMATHPIQHVVLSVLQNIVKSRSGLWQQREVKQKDIKVNR